MSTLRFRVSGFIKDRVMRFYGVPFSPFRLEPALVPFLPRGQAITLVDVGASEGMFADAIAAHCGIKRALLIEPQPDCCRQLKQRFNEPTFAIEECAIAETEGSSAMAILNFHYASSLLAVRPDAVGSGDSGMAVRERIVVRTSTLDDVLQRRLWTDPIDLLKLDVQGAELLVLKGGLRTLNRASMIWTEVSFRPIYEQSAIFSDVYQFMNDHRFRLCALHEGFKGPGGELLQADALFRRDPESST